MKILSLLAICVVLHGLTIEELSVRISKNPTWGNGWHEYLKLDEKIEQTKLVGIIAIRSHKLGPIKEWGKIEDCIVKEGDKVLYEYRACLVKDDKGDAIILFCYEKDLGWWYHISR